MYSRYYFLVLPLTHLSYKACLGQRSSANWIFYPLSYLGWDEGIRSVKSASNDYIGATVKVSLNCQSAGQLFQNFE